MRKKIIFALVLILPALNLAEKVKANETYSSGFTAGAGSEQLGVNTLGIEAGYNLPFGWSKNIRVGAGYNTNRLYRLFSPNQVPVDYLNLNARYFIPVNTWFIPYAGLRLRMAGLGIDTQTYPDLAELDTISLAAGVNLGINFLLGKNFSVFTDITGNYPASFAFPYLSWGFGGNYHF